MIATRLDGRGRRLRRRSTGLAVLTAFALTAAACGSDDEPAAEPADTEAPTQTDAPVETDAPAETEAPADSEAPAQTDAPVETDAPDETEAPVEEPASDDPKEVFPSLGPPTGEPILLGLVNTEGVPGLDFPDIRLIVESSVDYLNQHGGIGGRPVELESCVAAGSPETSQACGQELVGKGVELVMVGLDLFPDYPTFTAAGVPVVGVLPIMPGDYTANAVFLTGGNATTTAAMAAVAKNYFQAETVGIVSSDNAGANATEAGLTAALDVAGIAHTTVKGGDNETDAGYQGLMREAASDNPDLLFSLYSDAGCIGTIRGRAALGIEIPVLTTSICSSSEVIEQVGDDALGWHFLGVQTQEDTPELLIFQEIVAPVEGVPPEEVDSTATGLGGLGLFLTMSLAMYGNALAADGVEVTGQSLYDYLLNTPDLELWPGGTPINCGASEKYPAICAFTFPVGYYDESGEVLTVPGLDAVSALEFLP